MDVRALYGCSCGRQHGKWATFNGSVDDIEALTVVRSDRPSIRAAKRRREEEEREKRRLINDADMWKEYALNLLEWSRGAQQRDQNLQMFMEVKYVPYHLIYILCGQIIYLYTLELFF